MGKLQTLNKEQIDLIRQTVAADATDLELQFLLELAQAKGLDVFSRQICMIKRWDSRQRRSVGQPQITIDGLRVLADRTGNYVPGDEPVFEYNEDKKLVSATAYVKKYAHGDWHVVSARALYDEYVPLGNDGKIISPLWGKMPHVMLAKVAESLALRKAFPDETSGLYTREEMDQAQSPPQRGVFQPTPMKAIGAPQAVEPEPVDEEVEDTDEPDEDDESSHLRAISGEVVADTQSAIHQRLKTAMENCFQELGLTSKQFDDWYFEKCVGQNIARQQELLSKLQTRVMEKQAKSLAEVEVTGPMADQFSRG